MKFCYKYIVIILLYVCSMLAANAQDHSRVYFHDIEYNLYNPKNKDILSLYLLQNDSSYRQYEGVVSKFSNSCSGHPISITFYAHGMCLISYGIPYIGYWVEDAIADDRYVYVLGAYNYPYDVQEICSFYPDMIGKHYNLILLHQVADTLLYIPNLETVVRRKK